MKVGLDICTRPVVDVVIVGCRLWRVVGCGS